MMTCLLETRESYAEEIVVELTSDGSAGEGEVEENVRRITEWVTGWKENLDKEE
jgi:adenylate kinase